MERQFKKVLITGISCSGGSYLAEYIVNNHPETEVHGIARWHSVSEKNNLENIADKVKVHECDLNDLSSVIRVLKEVKPDGIFHLASHANVRASFINPIAVLSNNILGTANLFEAVRIAEIDPVIQLCSTSEVYGQVDPKNVPIKEDCPLNPSNPYAVSKLAQDSFATQVAKIEAGLQKELRHGNLDSTRTLIDVRDAMESYWEALLKCRFGEAYNIGGATVITVGDFLNVLKKKARCEIPSSVDPNLLRPTDVTLQIPNISKFQNKTGWKPKYSFEKSVDFRIWPSSL